MIFSSMEYIIKYVHKVLNIPASTHVQEKMPPAFALVDRTGGEVDYPHDNPEYSVSIWAKSEAKCEDYAYQLAIGLKTVPPDDYHINAVGVPTVFSYGRDESGYYIWQVTVTLAVNIQDEKE